MRFDRYSVAIGGKRVHVQEAGMPGGTPVLLLHGNPTWSFLWRKVADELRGARMRLIMPDLVGLGLSDKPDSGYHTIERHASTIRKLLDGLDPGAKWVLGVQDWGGPIATHAFHDAPDRVAGLLVLNTVLGPPKPDFKPARLHVFARRPIAAPLAFRLLGFPQRALHQAQGDKRSIAGETARAYKWPLRSPLKNAAPLALARMVPDSHEHHSIEALRRCLTVVEHVRDGKIPAAIVWGDRDPMLGRARSHIESLLPHAPVTRTDAGHFLQEEVPMEIATALRGITAAIAP